MIKKTLSKAVAGTAAAGVLILPAATTIAPQFELVKCKYPNSVVTDTELIYPTVIKAHTQHSARVNVDGQGGPDGYVVFQIPDAGIMKQKNVNDGRPVKFKFGKKLDGGRTYTIKAKFFGKCKFRDSSDQGKVTVLNG